MVKYITAMRILRASRLQLSFRDITNFKFGLQSPVPFIDVGDMTWDTGDLTVSLMPLLLPVLRGRYSQLSDPAGYLARYLARYWLDIGLDIQPDTGQISGRYPAGKIQTRR